LKLTLPSELRKGIYTKYLPPWLKKMMLSMAHHTDIAYKEDPETDTNDLTRA